MPCDKQSKCAQKDDSPHSRPLPSPDLAPDIVIDITTYLCPMTFVRTRLALDRLRPGQILSVRLSGDEPRANVPRSAMELGHEIIGMQDHPDGATTLLIRKH
jgi:tRNA 2-thiouridine synthesizing protein A